MREEIMDILEWLVHSYSYNSTADYPYEAACDKLMELFKKENE